MSQRWFLGKPAAAIALAAPVEADVGYERGPQCRRGGGIPFPQPVARHDAGARSQFCGQVTTPSAAIGFITYKTIQWRRDDCATFAFLFKDQVIRQPHPQVQPCGHSAPVMAGG
jgi:hypothetical protein